MPAGHLLGTVDPPTRSGYYLPSSAGNVAGRSVRARPCHARVVRWGPLEMRTCGRAKVQHAD